MKNVCCFGIDCLQNFRGTIERKGEKKFKLLLAKGISLEKVLSRSSPGSLLLVFPMSDCVVSLDP